MFGAKLVENWIQILRPFPVAHDLVCFFNWFLNAPQIIIIAFNTIVNILQAFVEPNHDLASERSRYTYF